MKKLLTTLMICLALLPIHAQAESVPDESDDSAIYEMQSQSGEIITTRAGRMYIGDEYISADNQLYRVIAVDDQMCIAIAEHLGEEPAAGISAFARAETQAQEGKSKRIAMYSTHSDESYEPTDGASSLEEDAGIYDVGHALKDALEEHGISVEYSEATHLPHDAGAYRRSRRTAEELLKSSPDVLIDIHRDGIPDPDSYETEVHGEEISKVRLLVGRSNPNADANREFAKRLKAAADEKYPGLIKDIFIGKGNYNQELFPQSILLEFGTHTIDKDLAIAATKPMADIINTVVFGGSAKAESTASIEESTSGFKGIGWLIAIAVIGSVLFALISTGKWRLVAEKFSRSASEITGGTIGKKPKDKS